MIYDIQVCHLEESKMSYKHISVASFHYTFARTFLCTFSDFASPIIG